jgi:hypothetical protein
VTFCEAGCFRNKIIRVRGKTIRALYELEHLRSEYRSSGEVVSSRPAELQILAFSFMSSEDWSHWVTVAFGAQTSHITF